MHLENIFERAGVLKKIADALGTTTDYLMHGGKGEKAMSALDDAELLQQFKAVDSMDKEDKAVLKNWLMLLLPKGNWSNCRYNEKQN